MKLPSINNRELLPLRLIPFVTGFKPAPHSLVRLLAQDQGLAFPLLRPEDQLFAYHLDTEGVPAKMIPKEWKTLAADMIILENQIRRGEEFEDENYRPWRLEAIKLLPSRVFVWKDEFEAVFQASFIRNGRTYSENATFATNELNFHPFIEPPYLPVVWEGFEALRIESPVKGIDKERTYELRNDDAPAKKANAKEIESLLKLVIAMAIGGYGFDPNQKKSPIPAELTTEVERVGLSIDVDTVRKWMQRGVELLPPDWNKKD